MRHLSLTKTGLRWADAPDATLTTPRSAVVRPVAAATCDFDHLVVSGSKVAGPPPFPIGHECVAEVVAVGTDVTTVDVGDVVAVPFQVSCGTCDPCRRGATNACIAVDWLSCYGLGPMSGDWGGVVADLVAVPFADAMLVPVPAGVSPQAVVAAGCNIVDAYRCVAPQLETLPGARVLVLSEAFPNIALYATQMALALGAGAVTFHDDDPAVAAKAEDLGATLVERPAAVAARSHEVVVDASMNPETLAAGLAAVARGGYVTVSTMYVDPLVPVPMMHLFETAATLQSGQPHARTHLEAVLDLVTTGRIDPEAVTDSVSPWEEAPAAFARGKGKHLVVR